MPSVRSIVSSVSAFASVIAVARVQGSPKCVHGILVLDELAKA